MAASSCPPCLALSACWALLVTAWLPVQSGPNSSVPDIFSSSLSVVDLLFLLAMPAAGEQTWCFGEMMCSIVTALDVNSQFTSTYILTAMPIDHYLATVYPFTSTRFRKPSVAILVICMLWTLSFLSITPVWIYAQLIPLPGGLLGCGICHIYWYTLYQFFLVFAIPFASSQWLRGGCCSRWPGPQKH